MTNFNFGDFVKELDKVPKGLTFEDKQLTWDTAEDVKDVVNALENTKFVEYLKLEGNTLGVNAAAAIGKALEKHPEFRKAFWKNLFTRRLKTEIPEALKHLGKGLMVAKAQLTVLDLSDNALGPNGMVGLEELLRSPTCYTLQELHLNNCGLGITGGEMLSKALIDCHRTSSAANTPLNLKVFVTGRNRLENEGAEYIADIFSTLKTLEVIIMPQNSIFKEGITPLAESFKLNPNLRVLSLNDNIITSEGAPDLADALSCTKKLVELDLGDCLLKSEGIFHIIEAIEHDHPDLESIDLSQNEICSEGGLLIVNSLHNKPNLKSLNLDGNKFGLDGTALIREAMQITANPDALESLDDDAESDEEDGGEEVYRDEEYQDDEDDDGSQNDNQDDTTEEIDEDEEYQEEEGEEEEEEADDDDDDNDNEEAYTTTHAFPIKSFGGNDTTVSFKSLSFDTDVLQMKSNAESNAVENFCLCCEPCSLDEFNSIQENNKFEALKTVIDKFTDDDYLLVFIFATLKCAHLSKLSNDALEVAKKLYSDLFNYAIKTNQERRIVNYVLTQLGLLYYEGKFKPSFNVESCRFAVEETLKTAEIPSDYIKNAFDAFLKNAQ